MEDYRVTETDIWAYISESADKETIKKVELWKKSEQYDPDLYKTTIKVYEATGIEVFEDSSIQKAKEKFFESVEESYPKKRSFLREFMKYAAVLAVLTFSAIYFLSTVGEEITIKTAYGEQKEVKLPDGSRVWLNASSLLSYQTSNPRNVYMEGEAFFEVARNEQIPFTVDTYDQIKIKVLGTSFNVKSYAQKEYTETVLLEGKVELSSSMFDEKIQMAQ